MLLCLLAFPFRGEALAAEAEEGETPAARPPTCALGRALAKAGETAEAKKAYIAVLMREPEEGCASKALAKLNAKASRPAREDCETGEKLLDVHRKADAIESFKSALKLDPGDDCATDGLEEAGPSDVTRIVGEVTGSIPTVAAIFGFAVFGLFILLLSGYSRRIARHLRRWWGIRAILKPRLSFGVVEEEATPGKPGTSLTARVKQRLTRMRDEALRDHEYDLDFGRPREEFADIVSVEPALKTSLEKASDISDQTKPVAALLNIAYTVLPIPRLEIGTTLEPSSSNVPAATVMLQQNSKLEGATTLRGPAPAKKGNDLKASEYLQLADPAAVWVQFEVARVLKGDPPNAAEAESQALVVEGLDLYHMDEMEGARDRFENALRVDHRNWGAYVCLASAEARLGGDFERSIKTILEGLEGMTGERGG